ncbi:unnamed protein product [Closterium sp. NIES-65]|nr:unnamed protein product [Closterium sp. NIES-65]
MATLRSVFILALVPALYAAAAPKQRGDVTAGGSAAVDAASWGRKLLEASGGADVHVGGEEEEVREVTDGLDEAVRVLLASDVWERMKKQNPNLGNLKKYVPHKPVWKFEQPLKASGDGLDEAVRVLLSWQKIKQMNSHDCLKCVKPLKSASAVNGRSLLSAAADVACNGLAPASDGRISAMQPSTASDGGVPAGQPGEPLERGSQPVEASCCETRGHSCFPVIRSDTQRAALEEHLCLQNLLLLQRRAAHLRFANPSRPLNMATLRSVFILALVLVSLPALYAASAPKRGDVTAEGSASLDVASLGRKLLEASSGAHVDHVGGEEEEEEEAGEVTDDGLDEAVRVLQSWKQLKEQMQQVRVLHGPEFWERMKAFNEHLKERNRRYGGLKMAGKPFVWKPKKPLKASANAGSSTGKGAKGALQAGGSSILKTMKKGV